MEAARHIQRTLNKKLLIFLQYIKRKVSQLFLYPIVMQIIQIFYGGPVMFVVPCFGKFLTVFHYFSKTYSLNYYQGGQREKYKSLWVEKTPTVTS